MEKQTVKKVTTLSFLAAAILTYMSVNTIFKSLAGAFGVVASLRSNPTAEHGLPVVCAALVFAILQFNPRILAWAEEVITEVSKVVWPSRRDTYLMTVVVCVFVGIASGLLLVIDFISHKLVSLIIH